MKCEKIEKRVDKMRYNSKNYQIHEFYCINCGHLIMSIPRNIGRLHGEKHRKVLYCPFCKETVNSIECRNDMEAYEFKQDFEQGKFVEEAKESMNFIKESGKYD